MTSGVAGSIRSFSTHGVSRLLEALAELGVAGEGVCADAGLTVERLGDPAGRVEAPVLLRLFAAAEARTGDALIALHAVERLRFGGLASYLVGSQNTIAEALQIQIRFQALLLGADAVSLHDDGVLMHVRLDAGTAPATVRHLTEYCIGSACRLLRWLIAHAAQPEEIRFRHSRAGAAAEYERILACPVRFDMDENAALLSRATLAARLVSADAELAAALERQARVEVGVRAAVPMRDAVAAALRAGPMDRANTRRQLIARRLGISPRTLQRRLESEGTSFARVLDDMRRAVALELLADPARSVAEVSRDVGYADQFAFNKAFRRWTGRSPSAYRRAEAPARR